MRNLTLLFAALLISIGANAQSLSPQVLASSGDYYASSGNKLDWTLGEIVTETFMYGGEILTQGFHQANFLFTSIEETAENNQITIFPNPFSDIINVNTGEYKGLQLMVYNLDGSVFIEKKVAKSNTQLDFSSFPAGLYFIRLSNGQKEIKVFKIQKINQ